MWRIPGSAGILPAVGRRPTIVHAGRMPALPGAPPAGAGPFTMPALPGDASRQSWFNRRDDGASRSLAMYVPFELEMPKESRRCPERAGRRRGLQDGPHGRGHQPDRRHAREARAPGSGRGAQRGRRVAGNGLRRRPDLDWRRHHRHRPAGIPRNPRVGAVAGRLRSPLRRPDGTQHRHRRRQHRLLLPSRGSGAAAALPRRRCDAVQRRRDQDAAARRVLPRLQARRAPARRADHAHLLGTPSGIRRSTRSTSSPGAKATRSPSPAWR